MDSQVLAGSALVLGGGILQGIFALPMKYARRWRHENIWLVFAFSGLVLFPWLLTISSVAHVGNIYLHISPGILWAICGFGFIWGIGATLTGVGLNLLGIGLGLSIILGLSASVGSLVPMLILTPQKLATHQGRLYLVGTAVMLVGIALSAWAGISRDSVQGGLALVENRRRKPVLVGLAVCICSGIFSGSLNFSYAFGAEVISHAIRIGTNPVWAANLVAAPATTGGFIPNLLFCAYMFKKNSTASRFLENGTGINWSLGSLMGALWFGGLALYGLGISSMGSLGTALGWLFLTGAIILSSNTAGYLAGEWRGAGKRTGALLASGMAIVLLALWILSLAQP